MNINYLIFRNLKKNLKNYYLYVFALIFSVALYFAFVTLQYDPAMEEIKGSVKGAAGLAAASVLLVVIVAVFLLYANNIFIKRRGKEIGLFQLIGLTKGKIFRILSSENLILYFGSMLIGIFLGFASSRLLLMILFKIIGVDAQASLNFSVQALVQTVIVFAAIYLLIMLMNYLFIRRQSILSLFRVVSTTENTVRRMTLSQVIIGFLGISLILFGYYVSTKLFSGAYDQMNKLFMAMLLILGSVIVGTYLFYKGSVSFVFNLIRKSKGGYLSLNEVLSLSSIMFRMKSNALLLTIITTVSALAIGLLSLSYISYYSAEESSRQTAPNHFTLLEEKDITAFTAALQKEGIDYTVIRRDVIVMDADVSRLVGVSVAEGSNGIMSLPIVDEKSVAGAELLPGEALLTGSSDAMKQFMGIQSTGDLELKGRTQSFPLHVKGLNKESVVSLYFSKGVPTLVVNHTVFERLDKEKVPDLQRMPSVYMGIDITDQSRLEQANDLYNELRVDEKNGYISRLNSIADQKSSMGLIMFIVAFLGLTFLITSGCILYFKQMGEGEEEKPSYTILRKLGFTQGNLLRGIKIKQIFSFGIPLVVGLSHSYFAVQSGWFFFGTELWTPMFLVMLLYTLLYSIFGILSVLFYKRVIKESL
ncbi:ABC transporter permease [Paenibacillus sp. alder61]|uniref:FtsX-like permease family protein n=1 Tax=Paenibacillus faecis TaxID=862114 RepID=A0A5D0CIP5_9BACL|nr:MULTISPECIES: ABC transporter permease [Paenibacillus]MCA1296553.1 ABC transporter permease [Paenibacillus sp. alder61]TYA09933.1 FtsX-like permease family protein [Paenibacillus faecis]